MRNMSVVADPPPSSSYPLSLHDALPIWAKAAETAATWPSGGDWPGTARATMTRAARSWSRPRRTPFTKRSAGTFLALPSRSEEHTSELQSHSDLVCRLLLEKKNEQIWR